MRRYYTVCEVTRGNYSQGGKMLTTNIYHAERFDNICFRAEEYDGIWLVGISRFVTIVLDAFDRITWATTLPSGVSIAYNSDSEPGWDLTLKDN